MRLFQISDSHIDLDTKSRLHDLKNCIDAVNAQLQSDDIVIHTGDISHNGLLQEYMAARQLLDTLHTPYYVLAGNKDIRTPLREAFKDHQYLATDYDFIQYCFKANGVNIIVLDTVKEQSSKGELCTDRLEHLRRALQSNKQPTLIFMHHSPFKVEEIPDPWQFENWQQVQACEALLSEHPQVQAVYCGHVHRNVQGLIAALPVTVLTCTATDLRKGQLSRDEQTQPMFKVIDLASLPGQAA